MLRMLRLNPSLSAVDIRKYITARRRLDVSVSRVKRRLRSFELYGRRPVKKSFISEKNRKARVRFAKEHLSWTVDDSKKGLFSDEN